MVEAIHVNARKKSTFEEMSHTHPAILDLVLLNTLILANNYCAIPAGERKSQ